MRFKNLVVVSPLFLIASTGFAATAAPLLLEVPKSRIEVQSLAQQEESTGSATWGIQASTWKPSDLNPASLIPNASAYQGGGLPYLSIFRQTGLLKGSKGDLDLKLGAGFIRLRREAAIQVGSQSRLQEQSLYLMPVKAGVEFRSSLRAPVALQPYAGLALLPTFALTPRSSLEKGSTSLGLPIEATAGLLRRFEASFAPQLDFGISWVVGSLQGAWLMDFGFHAGARFELGAF